MHNVNGWQYNSTPLQNENDHGYDLCFFGSQVTEYKHHQIEDLCKAGNQQKVQNPQDDDEIKMIDNPVSSSNKKVGRAQ